MDPELLISINARLEALETLQAHQLCLLYYNAPLTAAELKEPHARLVQRFAERTYPGVDPSLADHYADEVKHRIELILARALGQLEAVGPR